MSVVLVTHSEDNVVVELVARALRERGVEPFRFDTDRFPREIRLNVSQGPRGDGRFVLEDRGASIDLAGVDAVWYRRMSTPALPDTDPEFRPHCEKESKTLLLGVFAAMHRARWVDPIARVHLAHHKVLQMEVARRLGLETPDTLISNDADEVRRFFDRHRGEVVTKMLHSFAVTGSGEEQVVFTTPLAEADLAGLENLRHCPMVFQEKVAKDVEFRVTAVGDRLFPASIDSQSSPLGKDDWRRDGVGLAGKFRQDVLPADVEARLLELMRTFGLVYGAIDVIRTPEGRHVFLEINSAGEWGWIDLEVGFPVAAELAGVLSGAVRVDRATPSLL
mgnify:CR=1 FL=1